MNLQSPSGYAMPFELTESEPLEIIKEYGGSENDFNHGIDFKVRPNTWLKALATGIVSGVSSDIQKDSTSLLYTVIISHKVKLPMKLPTTISKNQSANLAKM